MMGIICLGLLPIVGYFVGRMIGKYHIKRIIHRNTQEQRRMTEEFLSTLYRNDMVAKTIRRIHGLDGDTP